MTSIKRDDLERKRREPGRNGTGRRLSPAIGARQRLSATQRSADRNSASHSVHETPASTTSRIRTTKQGLRRHRTTVIMETRRPGVTPSSA